MTNKDLKSAKAQKKPCDQSLIAAQGFTDTYRKKWVEIEYKGESALIEYHLFATERGGIWSALYQKGVVIVS